MAPIEHGPGPGSLRGGAPASFTGVTPGTDLFADRLAEWDAYAATPWGRLRYALVEHTLGRVVAGRSGLRVLDVGGGDGRDALPLAVAGHDVTVADPSTALLTRAGIAASDAHCADRVTLVDTGVDGLADAGLTEFDLVLCHNVLQYCPEPRRAVGAVVATAASGGLISLLCPNPAAETLVAAIRGGDPAEVLADLDASTARSHVAGRDVARVPVETGEQALTGAGCELVARFGIRCVTDLVPDDDRKADPDYFARLEQLELALCAREPFLRTARFWQLVGRSF